MSIDRFTAGAAQRTTRQPKVRTSTSRGGLLYTYAGLDAGALVLDLDITALDPSDRDLLAALVRLAVTDLDDALIGLGHATTRGYGTLRLDPHTPPTGLPPLHAAQQTLRTAVERAAIDHASATHAGAIMGDQSDNPADATTSVQGLEEESLTCH